MTRDEFLQWLSGFIDAEGNFQVFIDRQYLRAAFRIMLHIDDIAILHQIHFMLGVGSVNSKGDRAYYVVQNTKDLANTIIPLIESYTLRTVKWWDYLDFKQAVQSL